MKLLGFEETKKILEQYKIPFSETELVKSKKQALKSAENIGYPIVLKGFSVKVLHKTERGLVKFKIDEGKRLARVVDEIMKSSKGIKIEGVLIQKMEQGIELVCGMKRDASFGPVLMFGLGGIFVEVLKDVSFAISPITKEEALNMIEEVRGYKILKGYRDQLSVNISSIADILVNLSKLSDEHSEIKEIDLNPIFATGKNIKVADAKFLISS